MSDYELKNTRYAGMMTLYGRKTVLEILRDNSLNIYRLHLASSNRHSDTISEIEALAKDRGLEIRYHEKQ